MARKASIKETGEEIPERDWARFETAVGVNTDDRSKTASKEDTARSGPDKPVGRGADGPSSKLDEAADGEAARGEETPTRP